MKNNQLIIVNSCLILVLGLFSIDMYNPALPEMSKTLNVSDGQIQSLVFYYLIGFAISQLIYGPLSDKKGRVPIILFSIGMTAAANFLTFFADSFSMVAILRVLTGVAAGGCPVISRAILSDTFKDKVEISKALSIFSMASQVSPAFAPIIGGYISTYFTWNYNFLTLAIILVLGGVFVKLTLPETKTINNKINIDMFSGFKLLLKDLKFVIYSIVSAILFAITIGYFTASPFIVQNEYSLTPKINGFLFLFYSIGIVLGSFGTKKLLNRFKPEKILTKSLLFLCVISSISVVINLIFHFSIVYLFLLYGFLIALGCGLSSPLLLGLSLHSHSNIAGIGSALQGSLKMAGAAISLLIFSHANTSTTMGLLIAIWIMSFTCLALILFCQKFIKEV